MNSLNKLLPRWLLTIILILLGLICIALLWNISKAPNLGEEDFIAYWSGVYLFRNGLNPYDPGLIRAVEHEQTERVFDDALMAWNPPPLFVFLLPLGYLSFTTAKSIWLIINIFMVLGTCLTLAILYFPKGNYKIIFLYLMFACSFPQVIIGVAIGQVTFLVFFGLTACILLIKKERWFWAGATLIFTLIKPQIIVLPFIYLLFYMAQRHRYKGWLGLFAAGAFCMLILFLFRPNWINDLIGEMAIAPVHWATSTIGGLLSYLNVTELARYMIVLLLPLPFILIKYQTTVKMELAVALLTLITVPTTFFGWSFDQTILLIPIAQVFGWMARSEDKRGNVALTVAISAVIAVNYLQRVLSVNDTYYFWVPLFWWLAFGFSWRRAWAEEKRTNLRFEENV